MFKHLLVTLDGSAGAESVLPFAAGMARSMNAEITLLRVVDAVATDWGERGLVSKSNSESESAIRAAFDEQAQAYLDRVAAQLKAGGARVHAMIKHGNAAPQIIAALRELDADVIAMATHSRRGINRLMFGSVAEHVLHNASLPVLLIRSA